MEFDFFPTELFCQKKLNEVVIFQGNQIQRILGIKNRNFHQLAQQQAEVIDVMGSLSARAQKLKQIITTYNKITVQDCQIYMKIEGRKVLGFLKTEVKKLFYRDGSGKVIELSPLCVMDFYVHESVQRQGVGQLLFKTMLENQNQQAHRLAYDRPSEKLIAFLKKYYQLSTFIPQNNNFVVYNDYFKNNPNLNLKNESKTPRNSSHNNTQQNNHKYQQSSQQFQTNINQNRQQVQFPKINHIKTNSTQPYRPTAPWATSEQNYY